MKHQKPGKNQAKTKEKKEEEQKIEDGDQIIYYHREGVEGFDGINQTTKTANELENGLEREFDKTLDKTRDPQKKRKRAQSLDNNTKSAPNQNTKKKNKFERGPKNKLSDIKNRRLVGTIKTMENNYKKAIEINQEAEVLLPNEGGYLEPETEMELTYRMKQDTIVDAVDMQSADKVFDLRLPELGPYREAYTRNGRFLALAGALGHVAILDWQKKSLKTELYLKESIRDITFLHDQSFFAVAQKKFVYIYDASGTEIHCLKQHVSPNRLAYMPYHFLLASAGENGWLKYHDVSIGTLVAEIPTKLGPCNQMAYNPRNAIIHCGHNKGLVTLWSPTTPPASPLVEMLCHRGPISSIAIDTTGWNMVTAGMDGQISVWDLRTYKRVHSYFSPRPITTIDISQKGLLAVGTKQYVQIWKDAITVKQKAPYMQHHLLGSQSTEYLRFCPYEDVLGIGHSEGFSSILVPGSGEPNFDSFATNPFSNKHLQQETLVRALLDKIRPDMITLDPSEIGVVSRDAAQNIASVRSLSDQANNIPEPQKKLKKKKKSSSKRILKKQRNIWDEKKARARVQLEKERKEQERGQKEKSGAARSALDRFG